MGTVVDGFVFSRGAVAELAVEAALVEPFDVEQARLLTRDPDDPSLRRNQNQSIWRPWYAAAWVEAAHATGAEDLRERIVRAAQVARYNQVAIAIIERVEALINDDFDKLTGLAVEFDEMHCPYQATRTRELAQIHEGTASAPGSSKAGAATTFGLSDRELHVLKLVAAGKSNPEIAGALYISRKTAEHHVSRVLSKLGVATRSQAAAVAARNGLDSL